VLTVGGWFDAEDPQGPFTTYNAIEKQNPGIFNGLVMGPWVHGGWARGDGKRLGTCRSTARPPSTSARSCSSPSSSST
jgi:predicted acyl esterase